jgi:RimJ/RimL family protein N-acetyltransferase
MKPPEIMHTPRLCLRLPELGDAEAIFQQYASDPDVTRYVMWRPHESIDVTREFLKRCVRCWEEGTAFPWVIQNKDDGGLIGMVELHIETHRANIGYVIAPWYWGNGYATEAAKAVVDWALRQEPIYRVWSVCDLENSASARVLEKVGMRQEGILRRYIVHPNISDEPRDCTCYSIVK